MRFILTLVLTSLFYISYSQSSTKTIAIDSIKKEKDKIIESHSLNQKDKESLTTQAKNSLEDLGRYINVIVDKTNSRETKLNNINLALALFVSDSTFVETTSINNDKKTQKTIKQYLKNLMYLPYKRVDITWADIYVSDNFKKNEEDGKYYGIATFCQRFRAKSFKNNENSIQYNIEQTTCKDIVLIVERRIEGNVNFWDLKFGDIEVNEER